MKRFRSTLSEASNWPDRRTASQHGLLLNAVPFFWPLFVSTPCRPWLNCARNRGSCWPLALKRNGPSSLSNHWVGNGAGLPASYRLPAVSGTKSIAIGGRTTPKTARNRQSLCKKRVCQKTLAWGGSSYYDGAVARGVRDPETADRDRPESAFARNDVGHHLSRLTSHDLEAPEMPERQDDRVTQKRPLFSDPVLLALLAVSLAGNVWLGLRPVGGGDRPRPASKVVKTGTMISAIETHDASGSTRSYRLDDGTRPTVIFVFSPKCPWCRRSWRAFRQIATARSDAYRFVALSTADNVDGFVADFPVLTRPTARSASELSLGLVPQTLVFSKEGKIERVWVGAYSGPVAKEVGEYFALQLPGQFNDPRETTTSVTDARQP